MKFIIIQVSVTVTNADGFSTTTTIFPTSPDDPGIADLAALVKSFFREQGQLANIIVNHVTDTNSECSILSQRTLRSPFCKISVSEITTFQ